MEGPIRLPRVGRAILLVERTAEKGRKEGNTRTYRTPFVVRYVASSRRCKRDERGVWGIVGVGKFKAEAPRRRSGQPTPRCRKKRKREKKRSERNRGNSVAERAPMRVMFARICERSAFEKLRVTRFNSSTKKKLETKRLVQRQVKLFLQLTRNACLCNVVISGQRESLECTISL